MTRTKYGPAMRAFALLFFILIPLCLPARAAPARISLHLPEISDSEAFALAREFQRERENTCSDLPGAIVPRNAASNGSCTHPLDRVIRNTDDSIYITTGEKATIAAWNTFRRIEPGTRRPAVNHGEFLSLISVPEPQKEPWLIRKLNQILGWSLEQILRFISPVFQKLWRNLSAPGRVVVIVCSALLLFFFLVLIGRSLMHSRFVQRGLDTASALSIHAVTPVRWIDRADEEIKNGNYREALACLYRWLIAWVTDHNMVGRHQWWTNRQFIRALSSSKNPVIGVAQEIVSRYEDTEYGHRPVEVETVAGLRDRARICISGGRP